MEMGGCTVGADNVSTVQEQHVEMDIKFRALPKRWISVTAPVSAVCLV
jgi:hypothetical protein